MKVFKNLMVFGLIQIIFVNTLFALTITECNEQGGACICIAFPGTDPLCTRSKNSALVSFKEEKQQLSFQYKQEGTLSR